MIFSAQTRNKCFQCNLIRRIEPALLHGESVIFKLIVTSQVDLPTAIRNLSNYHMIAISFSSDRGTSGRLSRKELHDFPRKGFFSTRKVVLTVPRDSSSSNTSSSKDDSTNQSEARQLSVMIFFFSIPKNLLFYFMGAVVYYMLSAF